MTETSTGGTDVSLDKYQFRAWEVVLMAISSCSKVGAGEHRAKDCKMNAIESCTGLSIFYTGNTMKFATFEVFHPASSIIKHNRYSLFLNNMLKIYKFLSATKNIVVTTFPMYTS